MSHNRYNSNIFWLQGKPHDEPPSKIFFASKFCSSSCSQSQNTNKGYDKGKLHGIFDTRPKLQFMQIRKSLCIIKALPVCPFTTQSTLTIVVSEVYLNALMNKIINK